MRRLAVLLSLLLLLLPQAAAATSGSTDYDGRAVLLTVHDQPAWAWFDAEITVACEPPSGAGTSRVSDGFYLWGTKYDADGNFVSAGFVGPAWQGCNGDTTRTYHLQLVLQGPTKVIELVTDRRAWPYSASKSVGGDQSRAYWGTVSP